MTFKVLVVDDNIYDETDIISEFPALLQAAGYEVVTTADGEAAYDLVWNQNPDLIVLDIRFDKQEINGIEICQAIRGESNQVPIILITAVFTETEDVLRGFEAGADDYVSKPFSLRELMVRLEAILRRTGKSIGDEEICVRGLLFSGKTLTATNRDHSVELTRREMDILFYLHRHHDRIISKKELLAEVWNYSDPEIETRTVDIHILKLRKKLTTLCPDASIIQTVRGEGYRLESE